MSQEARKIMSKIKRHPWLVVTLVLAIALLVTIPALAQAVSSDLVVTKVVDNSTPYDGATIRYTITAANNGPDVAPVVTVTDLLPAGVTYVADSGGGVYSSTTGIWSISSLITTTPTTLVITGTVSAANGTVITNTATVTGTVVDPNLADNSASAVLTVVNLADLAVTP
jgi:uncharacterized repeat protein (TIGR01451 family)